MSQENVEIVRSMYRTGDPGRFFDLLDEEVEVDVSAFAGIPDHSGLLHGKDAVISTFGTTRAPGTTTTSWSQSRSSTRVGTELSRSSTSADVDGEAGPHLSASGRSASP